MNQCVELLDNPEPKEPEPYCICTKCREHIWPGEIYGYYDGETCCTDCLELLLNELSTEEKYEAIGMIPGRAV